MIFAIFCSIFLVFSSLKAFPGAAPFSGGEEESFSQKIAKITKSLKCSEAHSEAKAFAINLFDQPRFLDLMHFGGCAHQLQTLFAS